MTNKKNKMSKRTSSKRANKESNKIVFEKTGITKQCLIPVQSTIY